MVVGTSSWNIGKQGEELAVAHYRSHGFTIIETNFQYYRDRTKGRKGEIDIIASKQKQLHFIEVKTRLNLKYGHPLEQISQQKVQFLYKTAQKFLTKHPEFKTYTKQFDLCGILHGKLQVFENAITL